MNTDTKDEVVYLYLDDIIPNRFQPREVFDEKALKELAVSIKEHGVIQPIIVRSVKDKYEIIAGERRYKASALAGQTKIPAIIRNLDDKESSKVALLENLQRKNLTPIEEARTYQKILEIDQMTQDELAKTMGKSQSAVANKLRLLSLPDEIQDSLLKEQISERHARALLNLNDAQKQKDLLKKIMQQKMSVRAVEEEIKRINSKVEESDNMGMQSLSDIGEIKPSEFLNNTPLVPTAAMPVDETEEEIGTIKVVPPSEGNKDISKFINYTDSSEITTESAPAELKEEPKQISTSNDLDSLLNIKSADSAPSSEKFLSDADKYIKTEGFANKTEKAADYFQKPDFSSLSIPEIPENINYTLEEAADKIRELVEDLREHGINIQKDEMNFEKTFQVILKINKNEQ